MYTRCRISTSAYQSIARRNTSAQTVVSIPCQHVDYAVSLLHPSVPKYLFTSSTATDGHCSTCNLLDAANLARATLATCDALDIASFRLVYTGKALWSSLSFHCDVQLQCSCRRVFPPLRMSTTPDISPSLVILRFSQVLRSILFSVFLFSCDIRVSPPLLSLVTHSVHLSP